MGWGSSPRLPSSVCLQHLFNTLLLNKVILISLNLYQIHLLFHDLIGFLVSSISPMHPLGNLPRGSYCLCLTLVVPESGPLCCQWPSLSLVFHPHLLGLFCINMKAARNSVLAATAPQILLNLRACLAEVWFLWTGHFYT